MNMSAAASRRTLKKYPLILMKP